MPDLVTAIIVVGLIAAAMAALVWLAARARRRGTAGSAIAGAMAAYDEGMHGTAYDAFVEMQEQDETQGRFELGERAGDSSDLVDGQLRSKLYP